MFIKKAVSTLLLYECVFMIEWKEEKDSGFVLPRGSVERDA